MASGTPPANKRNSLQRLSHIFQLASPSFVRLSLDANSTTERKKSSASTTHGSPLAATFSPTRDQHERTYNPTASILSAAESSLSSPLSPLLPPTPTTFADLPVPPTSNDLAANDKAMLMRKMRKLSRVLGELPVPEIAGEDSALERRLSAVIEDDPRPSSTFSRMTSVSKGAVSETAKKAFRRSFTLGSSSTSVMETSGHDVHRVKSLSALRPVRPSLNISSTMQRSADVPSLSPNSPITFAWPEGDKPGNTPNHSTPSSPHPYDSSNDSRSTLHKFLKRRDSTASSVLLADQNLEQVHRTRAAKLARHLGENVPPEILRRAASPPPQATSPSSPAAGHLTVDETANQAASLRANTPSPLPRRPLSLDFRALKGSGTASAPSTPPHSANTTFQSAQSSGGLRRARSLWTKASNENDDRETTDDDFSRGNSGTNERPSNEKQRVLNVKRARKMAQLFGDNPPSALFQITSFGGGSAQNVGTDDASSIAASSIDGHGRHRDSLATIISISTTSLAPSNAGSNSRRLRDSYISLITTSSEMSIVLTERDGGGETSQDLSNARRRSLPARASPLPSPLHDDVKPAEPEPASPTAETSATKPTSARPNTSEGAPAASGTRQNHPRFLSLPSEAVIHQSPRTAAPFSDLAAIVAYEPTLASTPAPAKPSPEFQTRRRRAAKLSKFFGVEVGELAGVLPQEIQAPAVPEKAVLAQEQAVLPECVQQRPSRRPSTTVAEAKNKRRFLGLNEAANVKEVDVTQVMDQLRRMKNR